MLVTACLAYAAFAALCLAMERHWSDRFGRGSEPGRWQLPLQLVGVALLVISLALCLADHGFGIGLVAWLGSLTAAGLALVLTLSYWPKVVTVSGPVSLGFGLVLTVRIPGL